jgi:hypothetical protein
MRAFESEISQHSVPVPGEITKLPSRYLTKQPLPVPLFTAQVEEDVNEPENSAQYIPVGVLRVCHANGQAQRPAQYSEKEVSRLRAAKWIYTVGVKNHGHPEWTALRIFVLPEDVCRGFVPRGNTALRQALKLLMSKIDSSKESWEGRFDPSILQNTASTEEDESLFYIFNTLESPNPDISRVSDPYSQRAMNEILSGITGGADIGDEGDGVSGLKTPLYSYQRRSAATMIQREVNPGQTTDPRLQPYIGPTGRNYYYDREEGSIVHEKKNYSEPCGGKIF